MSLARIASEPLILYSRADYSEYDSSLEALFAREKGKPSIAEQHDSVTSLIATVEAGRGIPLVSSCVACLAGPRLKMKFAGARKIKVITIA